jgi:hypothetical protein
VRHYDGYRRKSSGWKSALSTMGLSVVILAAFAGSVYLFRKKDAPAPPKAAAVAQAAPADTVVMPPTATSDTTADLIDQRSGLKVGTATRGMKDGSFELTIAMDAPAIDRTAQSYVAWLLRPLPFDFFSMGEMTTDATGQFVTDWTGEADKDYGGYTHVLILLQPKGDPDPGADQVIKGAFGSP